MAKILIVEDGTFFRSLFKETLLSQCPKIDILEAPIAEEALRKVNGFTHDLIFVDIRLAGNSGLEFTRKIRGKHPSIPISILSNYDLSESREAAKQYHADHFLSKDTITKENILALVTLILSRSNHFSNGHKQGHPS